MNAICLEELKKIELDILIYIDQVCRENNLRYFLCGGTLLGAVRHKGFIPWDDDIDICMPRPDYDKFMTLVQNEDGKYKILLPGLKDYYYNFAKVVDSKTVLVEKGHSQIDGMGVYIDIFPLEGLPDEAKLREKHFNKLNNIRNRINIYSVIKPGIRKNLIAYMQSMYLYFSNKKTSLIRLQKEYENSAKQYKYENSDYVYATGGAYGKKDIFSRELFSNSIDIEFEGNTFSVPKDYDAYLKQLYGNYMQLPPIEKRISNHSYEASYR